MLLVLKFKLQFTIIMSVEIATHVMKTVASSIDEMNIISQLILFDLLETEEAIGIYCKVIILNCSSSIVAAVLIWIPKTLITSVEFPNIFP